MRLTRGIALLATIAASIPIIGRLTDERNIRALAGHVGCSKDDARRLYHLARQHGYGAAYTEVFGDRRGIVGDRRTAQPTAATPPFANDRRRGDRRQHA